jgi:peptidoglycan/LPS O-acetylase OafA/YrhL
VPGSERPGASAAGEGFRPDIEGLRGLAILLVVIFHATLLSGAAAQLSGGFIGVDLFFVISGFLITGLLLREHERHGTISFSRFYARRVRRILPAAGVVLLVTIPASYLLVSLLSRPDTMSDAAAAALSIANIRFALTTDYFNPAGYSPFLHFWSLGVEEQFYLIWPLLFLAAAWHGSRRRIGAALVGLIIVSLAASLWLTDRNPGYAFYLLPTRAWQLASGGLLALIVSSPLRVPSAMARLSTVGLIAAGWAGAVGLIAAALLFGSNTAYPGLAAIVPTIAAVALIASGAARFGPGALLRLAPLRFLGKISYSLYLWHWPILILGALALNHSLAFAGSANGPLTWLSPAQACGLALAAVAVAALSWAWIEEPFRRGQIHLPRPSRLVLAGATTMLTIAIVGVGLGQGAQSTLAGLSVAAPVDSPALEAALSASATIPSASSSAAAPPSLSTVLPGSSATAIPLPTPTPAFTPALSPAPESATTVSYSVRGLKPSVAAAPKDFELPWTGPCLGLTNASSPPAAGNCVYGDKNGSYSVALIGDSHASAFFPAVNAVALAHGWKLLVFLKVNCQFIDLATYDDLLKREYTECETWNRRVVATMNAAPTNLVIVTMNHYIEALRSADSGPTTQGQAIAREIGKLPAASRVVLVTDVLYPPDLNIPGCLSDHSDWRSCDYSRAIGLSDHWGQREQVAADAANIPLIDTEQWICPGAGDCPPVIDGMIVFRDEHHLTATFASSLAPKLDVALTNIFNIGSPEPSPSPAPTSTPPY